VITQGQITIDMNSDRGTISIPIINDDVDEENETFFLELQSVINGSASIDNARSVITIIDNDGPAPTQHSRFNRYL